MAMTEPTYKLLPVDQIQLDLSNPRIAKWLEMYKKAPTAEGIAMALRGPSNVEGQGGPSFYSLKQSILTNRGVIHPIYRETSSRTEAEALIEKILDDLSTYQGPAGVR